MSAKLNKDDFINKSKNIHGDIYDYTKVCYTNNSTNVLIICPTHGEFSQRPDNHMAGKGCKLCYLSSENHPNNIRKNNLRSTKDNSNLFIDSTRLIELSNGGFVAIDNEFYTEVDSFNWRLSRSGYATTNVKNKVIFMHKFIYNLCFGNYVGQIDHVNMDKLDCRISNMRKCTHCDNQKNKYKQKNNSSGYKGVTKISENLWRAQIQSNGNKVCRNFKTAIEAAFFYDKMAIKMHGDFARLNFEH